MEDIRVNSVAHVDQLRDKKSHLEREIEQEEQRPVPDHIRITKLKREKLRIKDEIAQLEHT